MPKLQDLDVMILCGGLGTRLQSLDPNTPKVMMKFEDRPFLDIVIQHLKGQGLKRFILCTGHKSHWIEDYYKQNDPGVEIVYSWEEKPLGTGGAIKHARGHLKSDPFFVLNGDCYCDVNFQHFLDFHLEKGKIATIVASYVEDSKDFGTLDIDDQGQIHAFLEKQDRGSQYINAGRYCFNQVVFDLMPDADKFSIEFDVFPKIVEQGLYGFKHEGEFFDIGTPERFKKATEFFKDGKNS